jgi:hypothetical protein
MNASVWMTALACVLTWVAGSGCARMDRDALYHPIEPQSGMAAEPLELELQRDPLLDEATAAPAPPRDRRDEDDDPGDR